MYYYIKVTQLNGGTSSFSAIFLLITSYLIIETCLHDVWSNPKNIKIMYIEARTGVWSISTPLALDTENYMITLIKTSS